MAEPPRIWTVEFAEKMVATLNADPKMQKVGRGLTDSIQLRCKGTPDALDVCASYRLDQGKIELTNWEEGEAGGPLLATPLDRNRFLARTTAPYDIWIAMDKKEFTVMDAILSPQYVFEGAKLKVLRHVRVFIRISDVAQAMEKRYY